MGFVLMRGVLAADQGTPRMIEIAKAIQEGALAYLKRQFRTIGFIVVPLAVVVFLTSVAVEKPSGAEALSFAESGTWRTLAFLAGGFLSGPHRVHRHEPGGARQRPHRGRGRGPARCRPPCRWRSAPAACAACSAWAWASSAPRSS